MNSAGFWWIGCTWFALQFVSGTLQTRCPLPLVPCEVSGGHTLPPYVGPMASNSHWRYRFLGQSAPCINWGSTTRACSGLEQDMIGWLNSRQHIMSRPWLSGLPLHALRRLQLAARGQLGLSPCEFIDSQIDSLKSIVCHPALWAILRAWSPIGCYVEYSSWPSSDLSEASCRGQIAGPTALRVAMPRERTTSRRQEQRCCRRMCSRPSEGRGGRTGEPDHSYTSSSHDRIGAAADLSRPPSHVSPSTKWSDPARSQETKQRISQALQVWQNQWRCAGKTMQRRPG